MEPRVRGNNVRNLADLERKRGLLKRRLHLPFAKESQVATALGAAAVGLGRRDFGKVGASFNDLLPDVGEDGTGFVGGAGDLGLFPAGRVTRSRVLLACSLLDGNSVSSPNSRHTNLDKNVPRSDGDNRVWNALSLRRIPLTVR